MRRSTATDEHLSCQCGANLIGLEINDNFDTDVDLLRLPGTPADGGFGATGGDLVGGLGDGTFNTTPLVEAADTAPFFHTNHAASLEEAIAFYATGTLGNSPAVTTKEGTSLYTAV